jgi:hypothetical protein
VAKRFGRRGGETSRGETFIVRAANVFASVAATAVIAGVALCLSTACAPNAPAKAPAPVAPMMQTPVSADASYLNALAAKVDGLNATAGQLPGYTVEQDRALSASFLGDFADVLTMIEGDNPPGSFLQRVAIIRQCRDRLASPQVSPSDEAAVNTALQMGGLALGGIRERHFFDHPEVADDLPALMKRVNDLDYSQGPAHSQEAAFAARQAVEIVQKMQAVLIARLTPAPAAAEPGTTPTTEASAAPATNPTATPATAPAGN